MERLTIDEVIEHCNRITEVFENRNDRKLLEEEPLSSVLKQYWEHRQVAEWLKELQEYRNLEEQGLLIKLPCRPNEEVWIGHDKYSLYKGFYACKSHILSDLEDGFVIGRTKEEAEKALEEMG